MRAARMLGSIVALVYCAWLATVCGRPFRGLHDTLDDRLTYSRVVGLSQQFLVFGRPQILDGSIVAHITYTGGRVEEWRYPQPADVGVLERLRVQPWEDYHLRYLLTSAEGWPQFGAYLLCASPDASRVTITATAHFTRAYAWLGPVAQRAMIATRQYERSGTTCATG